MSLVPDLGCSRFPILTRPPGFSAAASEKSSMQSPAPDACGTQSSLQQQQQQQQQKLPQPADAAASHSSSSRFDREVQFGAHSEASSIIAHSPTLSGASSTLSTAAAASASPTNVSARKAVCTHMQLMRIYGPYKCHHCGRIPRLGWVYRCVQDYGDGLVGFFHRGDEDNFLSALQRRLLRESEAQGQLAQAQDDAQGRVPTQSTAQSPTDHVSSPPRIESDVLAPGLKPWMQRLADKRFYSPEQLVILQGQRQKVLDCISGSGSFRPLTRAELKSSTIGDPATYQTNNLYLRRVQWQTFQAPPSSRSITISPYWQMAPSRELAQSDRSSQHAPYKSSNLTMRSGFSPMHLTSTVCAYQTCSTCRPGSRDRTWQCMDPSHSCAPESTLQLPDPTNDNRLVSHPQLINTAFLKIMNPEPIPDLGATHNSDDDFYDDDYGSGYESSEISPDISSTVSLEGTPTSTQFDENRGWDVPGQASSRWSRPQFQTLGAPNRILRRASSMDPRLLRSSGETGNLGSIDGLVGLGIGSSGNTDAAATPGSGADPGGTAASADADRHAVLGDWLVRPGAQAALGFRSDEPTAPPVGLSRKPSAEALVVVADGAAVTEEAVVAGDADIIMPT